MADFSKPTNAPPHVSYLLNQSPPKIILQEPTWAPIIVHGRDKTTISSDNKMAVSEEYCTFQRNSDPQLAWIFGRAAGHASVKFHSPNTSNLPDLYSKTLQVQVKEAGTFATKLDEPNLMVIAPEKDLKRYDLQNIIQVGKNHDPHSLFTEILDRIEMTKTKEIRHLVFQSHGSSGHISIFGKHSGLSLNADNVDEFGRLAGKVDSIWMLSCVTCNDQMYMRNVVKKTGAYVVGSTMNNPQKRVALGRNEIHFDRGSTPIVMTPKTNGLIWRGDYIGGETVGAHRSGNKGHVSMRPV